MICEIIRGEDIKYLPKYSNKAKHRRPYINNFLLEIYYLVCGAYKHKPQKVLNIIKSKKGTRFFHYICARMKMYKKILVSVLLVLTVTLYKGHCLAEYSYYDTNKIENTSNAPGLVSADPISEEDVPLYFSLNTVQLTISGGESFKSLINFFPPKLYYSIWLPPDIS
jgi:hypothetical protein